MFDVDGSQKSGSGTLLRLSIVAAAVTKQPLHINNIRQGRPEPGLKPQHLEAVQAAARLCNAKVEGTKLGSRELWFTPKEIVGGNFEAEIQTAGSIPMLFMSTLPICLFADKPVRLHVSKGGTDTIFSPTINYLQSVLFAALKPMGVEAAITVQKYGYYPKGMGEATMTAAPNRNLKPINLTEFGKLKTIKGISVCTYLADKQVAQRQAQAANQILNQKGYSAVIKVVNDESNRFQKGSSIALWAQTDTGVIIGADSLGELQKSSETVGKEAAEKLVEELAVKPTVDVFLADMLIPYMALAQGASTIMVRKISKHIEANIWLMEKMLSVKFNVQKINSLYRIEKTS